MNKRNDRVSEDYVIPRKERAYAILLGQILGIEEAVLVQVLQHLD